MGTPILGARALRHLAAVTIVAAFAAACEPSPTGPGTQQFGPLRIRPVLQSAVEPSLLGLDSIRVTIRRIDDGTVVADTLLDFDAEVETVLAWVLALEGLPANVRVDVEVRRGSTPMFAGAIEVEIVEGSPAVESDARDAPLGFIGPGADVTTLTVTPDNTTLTFGDTLRFNVTATDASGAEVEDVVVVWSSSDPAAPIDEAALLQAPSSRGTAAITARIPTGVTGTADAQFQPPAEGLDMVSGDGERALVTGVVPIGVRVVGGDGLGVEGIAVTFAAPPGGAVGATAAISDADGLAATEATLGTIAGAYVFTASIASVPPVTLEILADAGPAVTMSFAAQPTSTEVDAVITPAATVEIRDAFGNLTGTGTEVSLALGAGSGSANLSGTTQATANDGFATFANLSLDAPGAGFTLVATATGLPSAESAPFDIAQVPESVVVTPDATTLTAIEATVDLDAAAFDVTDAPIAGQTFAWTTGDASVATVDENGLVTAAGNGTATITASAGGASGAATITVQQIAAQVTVNPQETTLASLGDQVQHGAVVVDANGFPLPVQTVTWASSDAAVTIDAAGLATAVANGSSNIAATSGPASGIATVTVRQRVASVAVTPDAVTFSALQASTQLSATGYDASGNVVDDAVVAWSSDAAPVASVDQNGSVTAVANGTATITATADDGTGSTGVTVQQVAATLEVFPAADTLLALAEALSLIAIVKDTNGFAISDVAPTWSTLNPAVISVDASGLATAQANGDALVAASFGSLADTASIRVQQAVVVVVLMPDSILFDALGDAQQLTAEPQDANGFPVPGLAPSWSGDDPGVVSAGESGLVTAVGNGETFVRAMIAGVEGLASVNVQQRALSLTLTVTCPSAAPALRGTPPAASIVVVTCDTLHALGDQALIEAEARDANDNLIADPGITWTSLVPAVATVDAAGLVTAAGNGTTTVQATADDATAEVEIVVRQLAVSLVIEPNTLTLAIGESGLLVATASDANGFAVPDAVAVWETHHPEIAIVDASGLVTGLDAGLATIQVHVDALVATATVTVVAP